MDIGHALHHLGIGFRRTFYVSLSRGKLVVLAYWIYALLFQAYHSPSNRATRIEEKMLGFGCALPASCEHNYSIQERASRNGSDVMRLFKVNVTWCYCLANTSTGSSTLLEFRVEKLVVHNHGRVPPAWYLVIICLGLTVVKFLKHHSDAVPSALANAWKRIRLGQYANVTNRSRLADNDWNRRLIADEMSTAVSLSLSLLATFVDPPYFWQLDQFVPNDQSFDVPVSSMFWLQVAYLTFLWIYAEMAECAILRPVHRTDDAKNARCAVLTPHKQGCGRLLKWIEASTTAFPDIAILLALWATTSKVYSGQLAQEVLLFFVNDVTDSKNNWRMNMVFQPEAYIAACLAFEVMSSRGLGRFVTMIVDTRVFPVSRDKLNWALLMARELHWSIKRGVGGSDNGAIGNYLVQADTTRRRSATSFIIHGMAEEEVDRKHTGTESSDGTEVLNLLRNVFGQRLAPGDIIGTRRLGECTGPKATNTRRSRPILVQTRTPEVCQKALNLRKSVQYKTFSSHLNIQISEYFSKEELEIQQRLRRRFETFRNQGLICHMRSTYIEILMDTTGMTLYVYMPETVAKGNCLSLTKTFPDSSKSSDPAKDVHSLSNTIGPMERYLQRAEKERRRTATSLVIHGIKEKKTEYVDVVRLLRGLLDQPLTPGCVKRTKRLGNPRSNPANPRPMLVQTATADICKKLLSLRPSALNRTSGSGKNVFISEYFTREERAVQRQLHPAFVALRALGKQCCMRSAYIEVAETTDQRQAILYHPDTAWNFVESTRLSGIDSHAPVQAVTLEHESGSYAQCEEQTARRRHAPSPASTVASPV
ncbi:uncharacterized protein LOC135811713 [Sycon ciliatum]|uniref:uncharacterized protein LOC135811713 n=1 Tax=Sycon ciliatum TaxID=27933 RepID=UPI0031F6D241